MRIWDSADDGIAHLRSWGFAPLEYAVMVSAGGRYRADVSTGSRCGEAPGLPEVRYVSITFSLH